MTPLHYFMGHMYIILIIDLICLYVFQMYSLILALLHTNDDVLSSNDYLMIVCELIKSKIFSGATIREFHLSRFLQIDTSHISKAIFKENSI